MDKAIRLYYFAIDEDMEDSDVKIPTPQQWLEDEKVVDAWFNFKTDIERMDGHLRSVFKNNAFYRYMDYMFNLVASQTNSQVVRS